MSRLTCRELVMESAIPMADIHGAVEVYEWLVESSAKSGPDAVVLGGWFSGGWKRSSA